MWFPVLSVRPSLIPSVFFALSILSGCDSPSDVAIDNGAKLPSASSDGPDPLLASTELKNPTAYLPPQCYTKTVDNNGYGHNPCYVCHTRNQSPNYLDDSGLQTQLTLAEPAFKNHWANLFKDRSVAVSAYSDLGIQDYVQESNYLGEKGELILANRIQEKLSDWDLNQNGQWDGYTPDLYYHFDQEGFDKAPDETYTGWRTFAYYPLPGTFMPTNGSMDDVFIRLPEAYRQDEKGEFDLTVYKLNLAIVESLIKRADVAIERVDETLYQVDLNADGQLAQASNVVFSWAPKEGRLMSYVGLARVQQQSGDAPLAAGLYPLGTEFLHSVRYLDINSQDQVVMAPRMKELRYSRKNTWRNYYDNRIIAENELKERHDFPARTKTIYGNPEEGVQNLQGWVLQGFIEDKAGQLRPQTYEEHAFCLGCHGGVGVTLDTTFAFGRKFGHNAFRGGWYHWQEKGLAMVPEPIRTSDGEGEYSFYLKANLSGNEFRSNQEVIARFFDRYGQPRADQFDALRMDISQLLLPSKERALELNKAYKVIVDEQSFNEGRDGIVTSLADTVHKELEDGAETGLSQVLSAF